jgi:hypothetical protein
LDSTTALHPVIRDMNGDGLNDLLIVTEYVDDRGDDASNMKYISIYYSPELERTNLLYINYRSCDLEAADLDSDGDPDIIGRGSMTTDESKAFTFWLENPGHPNQETAAGWGLHELGRSDYVKDLETGTINRDDLPDIFARTNDTLYIYLQNHGAGWISRAIPIRPHEGMKAGDFDQDGDTDIALNGYWLECPDDPVSGAWTEHVLEQKWFNQSTDNWADNNCRVDVADMNLDGRPDILISNSEKPGYPVCWYECPGNPLSEKWEEHVIGQTDYCHTLLTADPDHDGDPDVITGELIHSQDPSPESSHPLAIFVNEGNALKWQTVIIDTLGIYAAATGDLDNDGNPDIIGPRNYERGPLRMFKVK